MLPGNSLRVADHQDPDPLLDGELDHLLGGLVMGVVNATAMASLHPTQTGPMAPPAARATLARRGRPPRCLAVAGLLILKMEIDLGPDGPPRDQQPRVLGDDRVGVDDAKIDPRHPTGSPVVVLLDGDGGGDRQPQPPTVGEQGHRADLLGWVGEGTGQPQPQRWPAAGHRQPYPLVLDDEGAVIEPDRDQGALAPREPCLVLVTAAFGGSEPGVAVAPEDRPCGHRRQLPEWSPTGEQAAQRLVVADRGLALPVPLPVDVEQPRAHVPGRTQQPVAAAHLGRV